jgi:hypothetical protein
MSQDRFSLGILFVHGGRRLRALRKINAANGKG